MSFSVFCLFLILLQNRLTEQATEGTTEPATDKTSYYSGNTEFTIFATPSDSIMYDSSTNSRNNQIDLSTTEGTTEDFNSNSRIIQTFPSTIPTTEGTTENSNSYLGYFQTLSFTEPITELTTEDSNTNSEVSTKFKPLIQPRLLSSDVSTKLENRKSNEQETKFYEKNLSSASVFGIVLGSIVSTIAVYYITVSFIKKYRRKSYIVRSPSIELGQAGRNTF